jgi:hypothetical protein
MFRLINITIWGILSRRKKILKNCPRLHKDDQLRNVNIKNELCIPLIWKNNNVETGENISAKNETDSCPTTSLEISSFQ